MILFSVLCTVYCGRGCVSLESEYGKELAQSLKENKRLRDFLLRTTDTDTGTRGVLRGPRGPKNHDAKKNQTHPNEEVDHEENIESKVDLLRSVLKPRNTRLDIVTVSIFKFKV